MDDLVKRLDHISLQLDIVIQLLLLQRAEKDDFTKVQAELDLQRALQNLKR